MSYIVNINPLPKGEADLTYNSNLHLSANEFTIYTDALSVLRDDSTGVGVSLVLLNRDRGTLRVVYQSMTNLGDS